MNLRRATNLVKCDKGYLGVLKVLRVSIKPTRCTISQLYFGKELHMFRTDLLSIIRSLNTVDLLLARSGPR